MGELTKRTIEVIKIRLRPIKALLFGILVLAIFSSPLIIGWVFFRLALLLHLANAVGVAVAAAFIGLALWPLYLVGQALERSSQVPRPPAANTAIDEGLRLKLPGDEYRPIIDVWKTTIEVQQHFNDLELRIRSFAVTLVVAVFGAVALAVKEHYLITIHNITFSLGVAACIAAIPGWLAFYFMDRHWYHRLLMGAVYSCVAIERRVESGFPEMNLATAIGRESPTSAFGFTIHSSQKIDIFYAAGLLLFLILGGFVALVSVGEVSDHIQPRIASGTECCCLLPSCNARPEHASKGTESSPEGATGSHKAADTPGEQANGKAETTAKAKPELDAKAKAELGLTAAKSRVKSKRRNKTKQLSRPCGCPVTK